MRTLDDCRGRRAGRCVSGMDESRGDCEERDVKSAADSAVVRLGCARMLEHVR